MTGRTAYTVKVVDREVRQALSRVQMMAEDPRALMSAIGAAMADNIRLCFAESRDPWGTRWEPLKYREGKPLIDTGLLRNSISYTASKAATSIGTNRRFSPTVTAEVHQFGTKDRKIPARPFVPIRNDRVELPATWDAEVSRMINEYADTMIRST